MKARKRLLISVVMAASAAALVLFLVGEAGNELYAAAQHPADPAATHNMLIVGEETVYLSHLPMFQEKGKLVMPHRYQAILEVTFARQEDYVNDRREHRTTKIYTLNPEDFVLPDLVSSDPQHRPLRSFQAKAIFRGHLERDGSVPIVRDVKVSVKNVTHFREFDLTGKRSPQLEYLLFGKGQELFIAHLITAPPDFDQMLAVKVIDHKFTDAELAKGVPVVFSGRTNAVASRLREKQLVVGQIKIENVPASKTIQVEVNRELYFEEGELRMPPRFESTSAEKQAGFP